MGAKSADGEVNKFVLVVGKKRAYLIEIAKGKRRKIASFSADGVKWWRDLFGAFELDGSWSNMVEADKAYLFARLYPYVQSPAQLVKLLREMEEFEIVYWSLAIQRSGARAIYAFKRLFKV